MKNLVKAFVRWLIIVLLVLNALVFWGVVKSCGQHRHDNQADLEDDIRIKTVTFLSIENDTLYFKRETKHRVDLGSFVFDSETKWDREKPFNGCYVALFCITHDYLYGFYTCRR